MTLRHAIVLFTALVAPLLALAAVIAPLWVYAISLALFGMPHVLAELRYVDERFTARLPRWAVAWLAVGLLAVAILRALSFAGVGGSFAQAELALGVGLVAILVPLASMAHAPRTAALACFAGGTLLYGLVYAPIETLVALALLHNLTPVGFLIERLRGPNRTLALASAAVVFVAVPLAILAIPSSATVHSGPMGIEELAFHLHAFVPPGWIGSALGERLFAAAAYLQVMHYAVVLGVLPRLGGGSETTHAALPWPSPRTFALGVGVLGAVVAISFGLDFRGARSGYGIVAAVHAWVEIPVLMAACARQPRGHRSVVPSAHASLGARTP